MVCWQQDADALEKLTEQSVYSRVKVKSGEAELYLSISVHISDIIAMQYDNLLSQRLSSIHFNISVHVVKCFLYTL